MAYGGDQQTARTQAGGISQQNGQFGLYSDTNGTNISYYIHTPVGTRQTLAETVGSSSYYYLTDLRGSVVGVTDINGTVQNSYSYDPYGNTLASTGSVSNPWRYAGNYYDTATGLYKRGARYYNPADAHFTQLDPSGQDGGYLYAEDDPVNYSDPSGYAPCALGTIDLGTTCLQTSATLPLGNGSGANPINFVGGSCQATYVYGGIALDGGLALAPFSEGTSYAAGVVLDLALAGAAKVAC